MLFTLNKLNFLPCKFNIEFADTARAICEPLFKYFSITNFGHTKIYENGSMLRVSTGKEWSQQYFENHYYNSSDIYCFDTIKDNSSLIKIITNKPIGKTFSALFDNNMWNILLIYEKGKESADTWFFATTRENTEIINLYINHLNIFREFISYFKKRTASILETPKPEILISTELKIKYSKFQENDSLKKFLEQIGNLNVKKNSLTKREIECVQFLSNGESTKKIALTLNISPRTVETHIKHVKEKLGCKKTAQLIKVLMDNKIL